MSNIPRYEPECDEDSSHSCSMKAATNGDYIHWYDHKERVEELETEIAQLKTKMNNAVEALYVPRKH